MSPLESFEKWKSEWTPEVLKAARRNMSAESFAKLIYDEQCKYVGWNHEGYCRLIVAHILRNLVDGLPTDIEPTSKDTL